MTSQFILCGPFTDSSKNRKRPGSALKVDVIPPPPWILAVRSSLVISKIIAKKSNPLRDVAYIKECLLQALRIRNQ